MPASTSELPAAEDPTSWGAVIIPHPDDNPESWGAVTLPAPAEDPTTWGAVDLTPSAGDATTQSKTARGSLVPVIEASPAVSSKLAPLNSADFLTRANPNVMGDYGAGQIDEGVGSGGVSGANELPIASAVAQAPAVQIPRVSQQKNPIAQIGAGLVNAGAGLVESLTSPMGAASLALGGAPSILQKAAALGFGAHMVKGGAEGVAQAKSIQEGVEAGAGALLGALALKHGVTGEKITPLSREESTKIIVGASSDVLTAAVNDPKLAAQLHPEARAFISQELEGRAKTNGITAPLESAAANAAEIAPASAAAAQQAAATLRVQAAEILARKREPAAQPASQPEKASNVSELESRIAELESKLSEEPAKPTEPAEPEPTPAPAEAKTPVPKDSPKVAPSEDGSTAQTDALKAKIAEAESLVEDAPEPDVPKPTPTERRVNPTNEKEAIPSPDDQADAQKADASKKEEVTPPANDVPSVEKPMRTFKRKVPEAPGGSDAIERLLSEVGKITHPETARHAALHREGKGAGSITTGRAGEYDPFTDLPAGLRALIFDSVRRRKGETDSGIGPAKAAQGAEESGIIKGDSPDELAQALRDAWTTRLSHEKNAKKATAELKTAESKAEAQTAAFETESKQPQPGAEKLPASSLNVGDKVEVNGETMSVTDFDPDTGNVTLEDGSRYGVQEVKDGDFVYGEVVSKSVVDPLADWPTVEESNSKVDEYLETHKLVEPGVTKDIPSVSPDAPVERTRQADSRGSGGTEEDAGGEVAPLPQLRAGKTADDLLQGDNDVFNLVSETAADKAARLKREAAEEAAQRVKEAAEAKALQDKQQLDIFAEKPPVEEKQPSSDSVETDSNQPNKKSEPKLQPLTRAQIDKLHTDAYGIADNIAGSVAKGQPDSVREAAFDAAYRNASSSIESSGQFNPDYMRKSAMTAAGKEAEKLGTSLDAPIGDSETTGKDLLASKEATPDQHAQAADMQTLIDEAMTTLPETERRVMEESANGRSDAEISDSLGIAPGSVKTLRSRARKTLAAKLITKLDRAIDATRSDPSKLYFDPLFIESVGKPALRAALQVMKAAIETGQPALDAIEVGIRHLAENAKTWNADMEKTARGYFAPVEQVDAPVQPKPPIDLPKEPAPRQPETTAAYNEATDRELKAAGLEPIAAPARKALQESWDQALAAAHTDPTAGARLVSQLNAKPFAINDVQSGLLLKELADRKVEFTRAQQALFRASDAGDTAAAAEATARLNDARDSIQDVVEAAKKAGTEWGRAGRFRQIHIDQDYSIQAMEARMRSAKGGERLTEAETAAIQAQWEKIEAAKKEVEAAQQRVSEAEAAIISEVLHKQIVGAVKQAAKKGRSLGDIGDDLIAMANKRLANRRQRTYATDPITSSIVHLVDEALIGTGYILKGAGKFQEWAPKMIERFGEGISKFLPKLFEKSRADAAAMQQLHERANKPSAGSAKPASSETPSEPASPKGPKTVEQILASAKPSEELNPSLVYKLAEAHAREGAGSQGGVEGARELMEAVHADLEPLHTGVTVREVTDAFSGYGKQQFPSQEAVKVQLREAHRLGQLASAIEDAQAKLAPMKSGPQRDKASQAVREQMRVLKNAMEEAGIETKTAEQQLASKNAAKLTAMENQIEDLRRAIDTATPIKHTKAGTPVYSSEVQGRIMARDALKKQYDALFERDEIARKNETYRAGIARRAKELKDKMAAGKFTRTKRAPTPLDAASRSEQAKYKALKDKFDTEVLKRERENRTPHQKFWDAFVAIQRAMKLTSDVVLVKLSTAAILREFVLTPAEEAIGSAWARVLPSIARRTAREGGLSRTAEAEAKAQLFTAGMSDAWNNLKMQKSELETLYGKQRRGEAPPAWWDYMGFLHGALKAPVKRAEFARSLAKRIEKADLRGEDTSDPNVMTRLSQEAYLDGQRAIFMQDNVVSEAISGALNIAQRSKNAPNLGPAVARIGRFLMPIVKVPTNIVGEVALGVGGLPSGAIQAGRAFLKGVADLPPEQADAIFRHLEKGSIGAALILFGYFAHNNVGGFFHKGDKRRDRDVQPGEYRIGDTDIPKHFGHSTGAMLLNIGATIGRLEDEGHNLLASSLRSGAGVAHELPFVPVMTGAVDSLEGKPDFIQNIVTSSTAPALATHIAKVLDTPGHFPANIFDSARRREPREGFEGSLDLLKLGYPWLREQVPEKRHRRHR